ncbi:MAG: type II toxin-antitoxin system RelE/ParE family toxin [Vitreimonas sp.]
MKKLPLAPRAEADLDEILEFLAPRRPRGAARVIQGLLEQCGRVCDAPLGYPACEELRAGLRRAVYRPYLIFFTLDKTGVRIERVVHGARDLPSLFKDQG